MLQQYCAQLKYCSSLFHQVTPHFKVTMLLDYLPPDQAHLLILIVTQNNRTVHAHKRMKNIDGDYN